MALDSSGAAADVFDNNSCNKNNVNHEPWTSWTPPGLVKTGARSYNVGGLPSFGPYFLTYTLAFGELQVEGWPSNPQTAQQAGAIFDIAAE